MCLAGTTWTPLASRRLPPRGATPAARRPVTPGGLVPQPGAGKVPRAIYDGRCTSCICIRLVVLESSIVYSGAQERSPVLYLIIGACLVLE